MENKKLIYEGKEIPKGIHRAMVNMIKYMVSNDWYEEVSFEELSPWLCSGTGLSKKFLKELLGNEKLYDDRYIAGLLGNPFCETEPKPKLRDDRYR